MPTRLDELKAKLDTDRKLAEITASFNGIHLHSVVPEITREERAEAVRYARRLVAQWTKAESPTERTASAPSGPTESSSASKTATDSAVSSAAAPSTVLAPPAREGEEATQPELDPGAINGNIAPPETPERRQHSPAAGTSEQSTEPSPEAPIEAGVERRKSPRTPIESAARIERASRLANEDDDDRLEPTIRTLDGIEPGEAEKPFALATNARPTERRPPLASLIEEEEERSGTGIVAISVVLLAVVLSAGAYMFRDRIPELFSWMPTLNQFGRDSVELSDGSKTGAESAALGAGSQDSEGAATNIDTGKQAASSDGVSVSSELSEHSDRRDEPGVTARSSTDESDSAPRAEQLEALGESSERAAETSTVVAGEASESTADVSADAEPVAPSAQTTSAAATEGDQTEDEAPETGAAVTEDLPQASSELTENTQVTASEIAAGSGGVSDAAGTSVSPLEQDSGTPAAEPRNDGDDIDETLAILTEDPPSVTAAELASDVGAEAVEDQEQTARDPRVNEEVSGAQEHLQRLGYDVGRVDGVLGPRTRRALRAFQRAIGVLPDGKITPELMTALAAAP